MSEQLRFQNGDLVYHPRRPEWGQGVVRDASPIQHEGVHAQRLAVDFSNKGRVVINTAVAPLTTRGSHSNMSMSHTMTKSHAGQGWLSELEQATGNGAKHELWSLPDGMTDPFASLTKRLEATLESYRFDTSARSLIDWAVVQTRLDDPLSKYTRHELEQAFPRFARDRDQHLGQLVKQIKRSGGQAQLEQMLSSTKLPAARNALSKAMRF